MIRGALEKHTDYGMLTILKQDATAGLQIKSQGEWIEAPPIHDTFVCNIGDMLDRMTGGRYRSTRHRVLNTSAQGRLSFPFFFDPSWDAEVEADLSGRSLARKSIRALGLHRPQHASWEIWRLPPQQGSESLP